MLSFQGKREEKDKEKAGSSLAPLEQEGNQERGHAWIPHPPSASARVEKLVLLLLLLLFLLLLATGKVLPRRMLSPGSGSVPRS